MASLGIALDLGTSGFRAQALDLETGEVLATAITTRHPLPGANVMDHLHFVLDMGAEAARGIVTRAVNRLLRALNIDLDRVARCALCGNPTQLSVFQGLDIRDLAYAGKRLLSRLGVTPPARDAAVLPAASLPGLELPGCCQVFVPPAVRHEVGADALALILRTGMLDRDETALAIDYGTNAEIALVHQGRVLTGSTAAGPALEGQHIACGMLAAPGAVADLEPEAGRHRLFVLDQAMLPLPGALVRLDGEPVDERADAPIDAPRCLGITGTGTIAVIDQGLECGLIRLPRIRTADSALHLGQGLYLTEQDLAEAGKAFGAIRAGMITLCHEAGIELSAIRTAYMAGASGTYVDPLKARRVGLLPPRAERVVQLGNTSLALARELVLAPDRLAELEQLADRLRASHCLFAASKPFAKVFLLEFSHWTEGMPVEHYRRFLTRYGLPDLPSLGPAPAIRRLVQRDIDDLGTMGLTIVPDIGDVVSQCFEGCAACGACVEACPERALVLDPAVACLTLDQARCNGVACRRCERACPLKICDLERFFRSSHACDSQDGERSLEGSSGCLPPFSRVRPERSV